MAELDILKLLPNIKRRLDNRILGTFIGPHLQLPSILILNPFYTENFRQKTESWSAGGPWNPDTDGDSPFSFLKISDD